jgi:hypothetical protein
MKTIEKIGFGWIRGNHYALVLIISGMLYFIFLLLFIYSG